MTNVEVLIRQPEDLMRLSAADNVFIPLGEINISGIVIEADREKVRLLSETIGNRGIANILLSLSHEPNTHLVNISSVAYTPFDLRYHLLKMRLRRLK